MCPNSKHTSSELSFCPLMAVMLYKSQLPLVSVRKHIEKLSPDCLITTGPLYADVWFSTQRVYTVKRLSLILSPCHKHTFYFPFFSQVITGYNCCSPPLIQITFLICLVSQECLKILINCHPTICHYVAHIW